MFGAIVVSAVVVTGWALAQDDDDHDDGEAVAPAIDLPVVEQLQVDSGLSDDDVLRIIARDNLMLTEREAALIDAAVRLAVTGADGLAEAQETGETVVAAPVVLRDFNDCDLWAREAMQDFYANGGWEEETLCSLDAVIVGWRKLVARYNRGIQPPPG